MPTAPRCCALALLMCLSACGSFSRFKAPQALEHETRCARAVMGRDSPYRMPLADPISDAEGLELLKELPPEARRAARAAGLEPVIATLLQRRDEQPPANDLLVRYHELSMRMAAFDTQVTSLAFELNCTRDRVHDLISRLDEEEGARQLRLATSSLIIGAVTGTAAGIWQLHDPSAVTPAWAAVGGGVVTAIIGAAALLVPERIILLNHQQNLLRPILEAKDPDHLYPSFVFRMLTARYYADEPVPRDVLMSTFATILDNRVPGQKQDRALEILGSTGSYYPREMLEAREAFLHSVEVSVAGVARDLELLDRTLVRLFATPTPLHPKGWP